jgi:hypothetical protein
MHFARVPRGMVVIGFDVGGMAHGRVGVVLDAATTTPADAVRTSICEALAT